MDLIKPENLSLSYSQLMMSMPYFIVLIGAMVSILVGVSKRLTGTPAVKVVCIVTLAAALYAVSNIWGEPGTTLYNKMLAADYFSNLFNVIFLSSTLLVMLSSFSYISKENMDHPEYYALMLFACLGMMLLASAVDLIVLFVALEIMSIAVYVLVGFRRTNIKSNEAALKYFILGSAVSAILLYGVALVYGATGSMNIHEIMGYLKDHTNSNPLFILGEILVLVGLLFKVAAVPFHMWMPDVYEGAPTTITSFMTTGLKAAAFAAFLRVFVGLGYLDNIVPAVSTQFHHVLWIVAVLTMFIGNVIALTQRNIKRMLAYSSIAHTGYLIVGFLGGAKSVDGYFPVVFYLLAYVIMNLGAFALVALMSEKNDHYCDIQDFAGMGFKKPWLGAAMMVFMLSMAGVPPTIGFLGKYMMFASAVQAGEIWLTVLAVLCSAISAYYYLRVIVYMYMRDSVREFVYSPAIPALFVIALTTLMTLQFGAFPTILINAAKKAALSL